MAACSSACWRSAASTTTLMLNGSASFRMKSKAPSFIDSITAWVVPECARQHNHRVAVVLPDLGQQLQPAHRLEMRVGNQEVGLFRAEHLVRLVRARGDEHAGERRGELVTAHSRKSLSGSAMTMVCISSASFNRHLSLVNGPVSTLTIAVFLDCLKQIFLREIGPEFPRHVELGVADLPEQEFDRRISPEVRMSKSGSG